MFNKQNIWGWHLTWRDSISWLAFFPSFLVPSVWNIWNNWSFGWGLLDFHSMHSDRPCRHSKPWCTAVGINCARPYPTVRYEELKQSNCLEVKYHISAVWLPCDGTTLNLPCSWMCAQQLPESLLDHLNLGSGNTRSVGMEAELPKGYRGTAKGDRGSEGGVGGEQKERGL